jgi:hypothetical protein
MRPIPNGFRDRATSLYSSKIVDKKEILRTVSNTGIYCSSDKIVTVYVVQYIFENSTVNINALCNSREGSIWAYSAFVKKCAIFPQLSYNVTINSHNGQLTLHTDSHASDSGAVRREGRTILGAKFKVLYSEIALSRKPFRIGYKYEGESVNRSRMEVKQL